jgi:hypothetical protein
MGAALENLNPYLQSKVDQVYDMVEHITGVTKEMTLSKSRKQYIVDARKITSNILRKQIELTCYQVAKVMDIDHSSVVHYSGMHLIHIGEAEYRRMYSAISGMYAMQLGIEREETLRRQFHDLQGRTRILLKSLKVQCETLDKIAEL